MADEHVHTQNNSNALLLIAVVIVVVLLFLVFGTGMFGGGGGTQDTQPEAAPETQSEGGDVNIEVPDEVDVNVNDAEQ